MKIAIKVCSMPRTATGAIQKLYVCFPKLEGSRYVIVSAVDVFGEPETYIFPANILGYVTNWGELEGSFKGEMNHKKALEGAEYTVLG